MKAILFIRCSACAGKLGAVAYDTADTPEKVKMLIDSLVLGHREDCDYYSTTKMYHHGQRINHVNSNSL